jgi:hypothetical protein
MIDRFGDETLRHPFPLSLRHRKRCQSQVKGRVQQDTIGAMKDGAESSLFGW